MIHIPYYITTSDHFRKELEERIKENELLPHRSFRFQYCLNDDELKQYETLIAYLDEILVHFNQLLEIVDEESLSSPEGNQAVEREYDKTLLSYRKVISNSNARISQIVSEKMIVQYHESLSKHFDYVMLYPVPRGGVYSSETLDKLQEHYYRLFHIVSDHKQMLINDYQFPRKISELDTWEEQIDKLKGDMNQEYRKLTTFILNVSLEPLTLFKGIYRMIKLKKIIKNSREVVFSVFEKE